MAVFSLKIRLFVDGRKNIFQVLRLNIHPSHKTIWFHCASLGEYEQGLPVLQKIKENYPNHKLILSFFSPSGFEVQKNNKIADVTVYLPLDTKQNARKFIKLVHPDLVFFVKYPLTILENHETAMLLARKYTRLRHLLFVSHFFQPKGRTRG